MGRRPGRYGPQPDWVWSRRSDRMAVPPRSATTVPDTFSDAGLRCERGRDRWRHGGQVGVGDRHLQRVAREQLARLQEFNIGPRSLRLRRGADHGWEPQWLIPSSRPRNDNRPPLPQKTVYNHANL